MALPRFVLSLRWLWEDRAERVPCHPCRGCPCWGQVWAEVVTTPGLSLTCAMRCFMCSSFLPWRWAQKSTTNAGVGIFRAGNLSRCGDVGHWSVEVDPAIPRLWQSSLSHSGQLETKSQSRKTILILPIYKCHATCLCLFNLSCCSLAFILIPYQSGKQVWLPFRSYCFEFAAQSSVSSRQSI